MLNVSIRPQPAAVAAVSALPATAGETSSDENLVRQIAVGSKPAMQALFARHRTYVYRWLRFVSNETLAEDLLSEVFLDVWRQAGRFECRSSVSTWLMSIARYKALSARRRRRHNRRRAATGPGSLLHRTSDFPLRRSPAKCKSSAAASLAPRCSRESGW